MKRLLEFGEKRMSNNAFAKVSKSIRVDIILIAHPRTVWNACNGRCRAWRSSHQSYTRIHQILQVAQLQRPVCGVVHRLWRAHHRLCEGPTLAGIWTILTSTISSCSFISSIGAWVWLVWNHLRLLQAPQKSQLPLNLVRVYDVDAVLIHRSREYQ